jgi:UDP-glucuronate 4-epimerase
MAGNPLPWKEDEKLGYQLNPYGYSKATNEAQFMAPNGLDVAIGLRFFTVYGPWGRPDMALFSFTKNIVEGKPIQLFNYGDMVRDFTYVDDIVQGCCIVIQKALGEEQYKDVYNIGYGQQVQLVDFVNHIEENLGIKAIRELVPKHPADTHETWSDTTKLQALGYKPTTSIEVGVKNFVEWYKEYYNV